MRTVLAATGALSLATASPVRHSGLSVYGPRSDIDFGAIDFEKMWQELRTRQGRVPDYNIQQYRATYWRADEHVRRADAYLKSQGFFFLPTMDFPPYRGCPPLFSAHQINLHFGKHHKSYVSRLNELVEGTPMYGLHLDELIVKTRHDPQNIAVFQNAAQHFNHWFFWKSIVPFGANMPPDLNDAIVAQYGSVEALKKDITDACMGAFGSAWVYWVYDEDLKRFDILTLSNAECPIGMGGVHPMLAIDLWEHAYYVDFENRRLDYVRRFFEAADWHWAERYWKRATGQEYHPITWY